VLFFTRDLGLVQALYKGGRTPKKQLLLQPFTPLWADFTERDNWYYVRKLEIAALSSPMVQRHVYAALYLNELLYLALQPLDAYPQLFDGYVETLHALTHTMTQAELESSLRRFEWCLLTSLGYAISLTHDAYTLLPIDANTYYQVVPGQGLVSSEQGMSGRHLLALARDELTDPLVLKTAKQLMRRLVDQCLGGKEIKTRSIYRT
jgi:DNA repair protein RecO (recombination protein O)